MALPTNIVTFTNTGGVAYRPFVSSGGNVYVIAHPTSDVTRLAAFKATDPETSWGGVGTNQLPSSGNNIRSIATYQVSDLLHVACHVETGSNAGTVFYAAFNMATDAWSVTPVSVDTTSHVASSGLTAGLGIVVDGSSVITIVYQGDVHKDMGTSFESIYRARSTDSGSSWGIPAQIDVGGALSYRSPRVALGASNVLHAVYHDGTNLLQRSINSSGTAQTQRDTGFNINPSNAYIGHGISFVRSSTTRMRFGYKEATTSDFEVLAFDAAADPSSFTSQNVDGTNDLSSGSTFPAGLGADGDHAWAAFIRNGDGDVYRADDQATDSWANVTSHLTGTISLATINVFDRGGSTKLAYTYYENAVGTLKYNEYEISVAALNLQPSLFSDGDTFFSATVGRGAVNLAASLFTDGDTIHAPTVNSTYALTSALFTDGDTFHEPTVTQGAANLSPALFADGDTFHTPAVSPGAVDLTPSLFTDSDTFYAPTVAATYALTAALFSDGDTFHTPAVTAGAVNIAPSLFVDDDTFFSATVANEGGTQNLDPPLFTDGDTFHAAAVTAGAVNLAPSLFTDGDTFHAATVSPGAVGITPSLFSDGDTFHAPTVAVGSVNLAPSLFTDGDTFYAPAVSPGAVNLAPSLFTDGDIFHTPSVSIEAQDISPALFTDSDTFHAPSVSSTYAMTAPLFSSANVFFSPGVVSTLGVTASFSQFQNSFYSPAISRSWGVVDPDVSPWGAVAKDGGAWSNVSQEADPWSPA